MRQYIFLFSLLLAILASAPVSQAQNCRCQNCQDEPCLKFLDDLRCFPYGTCEREPYDERMETERHDFTQSATTVGRGVVQLETGYLYSYKDEHEEIEQAHVAPEMFLRIGLSDDIEFRLRWNYAWQFFDEEPNEASAMDLIWSVKLQITEQCGWMPESALEIRSSVPTGGSAFTLGRVEAGFDYIYGWKLNDNWSLYGSTGYAPGGLGDFSLQPDEPQGDRFTVTSQSVALGKELTEKNTIYAEWYGLFSDGLEENFSLSFFNVGIDHYFTDDLLIDFRAGVGLTEDSEDFFTGVGGGVRF
jgi:outer membrane putative beta-barrel porin/alpha-amylase